MTTPLGQVTGELQDIREAPVQFGTSTTAPAISSTKAYTGSYSIRFSNACKQAGYSFAANNGVRAGVWLNHNGTSTINSNFARPSLLSVRASTSLLADVRWERTSGLLELVINGSVVDSIAAATLGINVANQWHHIGISYVSGANGACTFYFNGLPALTYSGSLSGSVDSVAFGGNQLAGPTLGAYGWDNYAYFDDFYVDGDISTDEAPPPDRFPFSLASAAGASAQWTPTGQATNIACVDEAVPNDDTDYVKAEAADLVDLYNTADITLPTDYGIVSVIPIALAKRMASGPTIKLVASDGVNADLISAEKTPGTSYGYHWESMPLAPDGGDWTQAKVNAAQFGVKSAGVYA